MTNLPPIQDRPDDTEGDGVEDHSTPADLLELHEALEYIEAAKWAEGDGSVPSAAGEGA